MSKFVERFKELTEVESKERRREAERERRMKIVVLVLLVAACVQYGSMQNEPTPTPDTATTEETIIEVATTEGITTDETTCMYKVTH